MHRVQPAFQHTPVEHIEALFALRAADDLADTGCEHVHRRNRPLVVGKAHVKRLDFLWIVHQHGRTVDVLFGYVALMLRLQVNAPLHRILKFLLRVLKHLDRIAVIHPYEFGFDNVFEFCDQAFLDALFKKRHIVGALGEYGGNNVFQQRFGKCRVIAQIGKSDFRFDHPEFRQVPRGVGILCAESRAEGVHLR